MNNVILALWTKKQSLVDHPRIIYAFWATFDDKTLWIHHCYKDTEEILLKNISFVSIVGQYDKAGQEYHHHDDKDRGCYAGKEGVK